MQISTVIAVLRVCVCVMKLKPPKESDAAPRNLRYKDERSKTATWANSSYNQDSIRWSGFTRSTTRYLVVFSISLQSGQTRAASSKGRCKMGAIPPQRLVADASSRRLDRNCASATSHIPAFEPAASNTCTHPRVLPLRAGI